MTRTKQVGATKQLRKSVRLETVLGQVVRRRRESLGMAQGELARKMGVTAGTASRLESGQEVSLDRVWLIARALAMPASALVLEVEKAVDALRRKGVTVTLRRSKSERDDQSEVLTSAVVGGLLGFLLGASE